MLNDLEIEMRLPLWLAFSELFLDTENSEADFKSIAETLGQSGLRVESLRQILADEVAPAFYTNLMSVAGEWQPWNAAQVRTIVLSSLARGRRYPLGLWLRRHLSRPHAREIWQELCPFLNRP